jgi:hypothetical protein
MITMSRWRLLVVAVGLVPVLVGCSRGCTSAGCDSRVSVDMAKAGSQFGSAPVDATLCVDGECQTTKVVLTDTTVSRVVSHLLPSGSPGDDTVAVTLSLARDGTVLVESSTDATLVRLAPNGLSCEPICFSSQFVLDGALLTPVPFETDAP